MVVRGSGTSSAAGTNRTAFRYLTGVPVASIQPGATVDGVTPRRPPPRPGLHRQPEDHRRAWTSAGGFQTVIDGYDLATATGQAALPATFKMGLSGSTGGSTNVHEIRNVRVDLPANITMNQTVAPAAAAVGGTVTFTIAVANDATNAALGSALTDAFPAGLSNVSWTATTAGGATVGRAQRHRRPRRDGQPAQERLGDLHGDRHGDRRGRRRRPSPTPCTLTPPAGVANVLTNTIATTVVVAPMPTATALAAEPDPPRPSASRSP